MEGLFEINNLIETKKLAKKFANSLVGGETILLNGDLGAGKTTFVKYVCSYLNVEEPVCSPTFTILKIYYGDFNIYHYDMYRINDEREMLEIDYEDIVFSENLENIIFIEWSEKIKNILPKHYIEINIKTIDETKRNFEIRRV